MPKIIKEDVIRGVSWVEIPAAGLRILCGTPEDATKHLMLLRMIQTREENGVSIETGPNAVLLSDVALQNGKLCNLAEFPVLQMLYRQGMLIPGHPNNTGAKPLLIGSQRQIDAQMTYISRGNYGLLSEAEIVEAGETPERAEAIMRMKLKFAFGKILPSDALLDHRIVDDGTVEIRNGVTIRRLRTNIFVIAYEDEEVEVDLTVIRGRNDRSAYPLGFHNIPRDYFAVVHSGQGDGWDTNRPCMASIVIFQGRVFLVDLGPNTSYSLTALGVSPNEVEGIFHTHCHDDHFAGITAMMRADRKIRYYATPLVRHSVFKKLAALLSIDEERVADFFEIHDLQIDEWNNIDGLEVMPFLSPHPVENTAFFFRAFWQSRYLTYAHLADIASFKVMDKMITDDPHAPGMSREDVERTREIYLTPVDVKKVDIGGGMIHGEAEDFAADTSSKIILAHRSEPLTNKHKEIGSSAPFGVVDTLIHDQSGNLRRKAFEYLRACFPEMERHRLRTLMNNPIDEFTPGQIILRKGNTPADVFLTVTGMVEKIRSEEEDIYNVISAGGVIAEHAGINGLPSNATFRAVNFVRVLRIPVLAYIDALEKTGLIDVTNDRAEGRGVLEKLWLFGESISPPVQNRIVAAMKRHDYDAGVCVDDLSDDSIYVIDSGSLEPVDGAALGKTLGKNSFFAEEQVLYGKSEITAYRTVTPCRIYEIPGTVIKDVPIIMWKLLEAHQARALASSHILA